METNTNIMLDVNYADQRDSLARSIEAIKQGKFYMPVHAQVRCAVKQKISVLCEALCETINLPGMRRDGSHMYMVDSNCEIWISVAQKSHYCSFVANIHAMAREHAEKIEAKIRGLLASEVVTEKMFTVHWFFQTNHGLQSVEIEELADDVLYDEAYPTVKQGVAGFIADYLASPEPVLILQGPPGTGKTRLIRAVLGAIGAKKEGHQEADCYYTTDNQILVKDQIFVAFITGSADAFVIEDADYLLKPRADGNESLHRFLAIADGVVRAQARKIIFSTNLPQRGDIDEALSRAGRCFARLETRPLQGTEIANLLDRIANGEERRWANERLHNVHKASLADIYKAIRSE